MNKEEFVNMPNRKPYTMEEKVFVEAIDKFLLVYNPKNYLDFDVFLDVFFQMANQNTGVNTLEQKMREKACKRIAKWFLGLKTMSNVIKKDAQVESSHNNFGTKIMDLLCLLKDAKQYIMLKALWPYMPNELSKKMLRKLAYNPNANLYDMASAFGAGLSVDSNTIGLLKIVLEKDFRKNSKDNQYVQTGLVRVMENIKMSAYYQNPQNELFIRKLFGYYCKQSGEGFNGKFEQLEHDATMMLNVVKRNIEKQH